MVDLSRAGFWASLFVSFAGCITGARSSDWREVRWNRHIPPPLELAID